MLAVTYTSGNQVKAPQTVTAPAVPAVPVTEATLNYACTTFFLPAHGEAWITVDTLGSTRGNLFGVYGYEVNSYPALVAAYGPDCAHQTPMDVVGGIEWLNAGSNLPFPNGYVMHVTSTSDVPFATYMDAQPFDNGY
ncbi:hypothetical protein [Deinococcus sonorensis]|uniref:Uncharacterized protein n=2 Tax=Deinococcus sonorensis TaxID=309891 RepID=A0AAU7UGA6_9DEIO